MEFSILIPVYKAEKFLEETLESALAQQGDYEILLVEDASPDASGAIMDRYAAARPDRVRVIHNAHQGTIFTRRTLLREARGEFCVWLDADDLLEKNALETLHGYLAADPSLDGVIYEHAFFYDDGRPGFKREPIFPHGKVYEGEAKKAFYEALIRGHALDGLWIKCLRTALYREDPADYLPLTVNPYGEDALHCLYPLTHAGRILTVNDALYRYRMHNASVMHEFSEEKLDMRFNEAKFAFFAPYMKEWGLDDAEHQTLLKASAYKGIADGILYFLEEGYDRAAVRRYTEHFVDTHPELASVARSACIGFKQQVILRLLAAKKPEALLLLNKAYRKIRH